MGYNRHRYNDLLYNASPDEFGPLARSIISAHTGPHIQAVVGGSPEALAGQDGLSFISDFVIQEGTVRKPPTSFRFPDLAARIRAVQSATDLLNVFIFAQQIKDLPASIFLVDKIPNLPASIFGLFEANLVATILGKLGELDLGATLQGTEFADLLAQMSGIAAPDLGGRIFGQSPANLGARIHTPEDLAAFIFGVGKGDLLANILGLGFKDLPGQMLGISAPSFLGVIKALQSATDDVPARTGAVPKQPDLGAAITPVFTGVSATISAIGTFVDFSALLTPTGEGQANLAGLIQQLTGADLGATIGFFSAKQLGALISGFALGDLNKDLRSRIQSVTEANLSGTLNILGGFKNLAAILESNSDTKDLLAQIVVDETFITTVLNIITFSAADLKATIGNPACGGGTGSLSLAASALTQHARNLRASIESFLTGDLGATVNSEKIFHAFDTVDVFFRRRNRRPKKIRATDTLSIFYSPFRGKSLAASITPQPRDAVLAASITATFPLPRVSSFVSSLNAANLSAQDIDVEEIRFQLEGELLEFIYLNGTETSFIRDPNQEWRINIRTFRPIAENLFGDFAAGRICRLGNLESFATLDEAVTFCIRVVLGLEGQEDLGASIVARGTFTSFKASLIVSDTFSDLGAFAGRVFPSDLLGAVLIPDGFLENLRGVITGVGSGAGNLGASIAQESTGNLGADITGV